MKVFGEGNQYKIVVGELTYTLDKGQGFQAFDSSTGTISFYLAKDQKLASGRATEIEKQDGSVYDEQPETAHQLILAEIAPSTTSGGGSSSSVSVTNLPAAYALPTTQETILSKIRDKRELLHEIQSTGAIEGKTAYVWHILGRRNAFVDATTMHDVCEFLTATAGQQTFVPVTTADQLEIVSTSANDSIAGTGTRTVDVTYLNASENIQTTTVTLNGTTAVPLTGINASAILWMEAATGGVLEVSQGTINLRKVGAPTTIYEQIVAGGNKSMSARVKVPAGYTAYMITFDGFAINQSMDIRIRATVKTLTRALSTRYTFQDNMFLATNGNSTRQMPFLKFPPGASIKISAQAGATGGTPRCDASFTLILIQN